MLPMLHKHTLITAALLASLSITGCGKKKDLITPPPPQQSAPTPDPKNNPSNGNLGGGIPAPTSPSQTQPTPSPSSTQTSPPKDGEPSTPPDVVDSRPAPQGGTNPLPQDYKSNDPQNAIRDSLMKRMTGGVTQDGLVYTSSSTDELLNFLRARNEKVDAATRRVNLEAAASVQSAMMSVDALSGDAIITLKIQEGRDVKIYNVAGVSSYGGMASIVRPVRGGNGELTTGARALEGTLKCLDLDGGCETTLVRLKIGSLGSSAILNLVFRNSSADLFFHLPAIDSHSDNPEFLVLQDFALNTIKKIDTSDRIKTARMSSWEVVNGRSGVNLLMKGYNNELLAFAGPLLAPEAGTGVNVNLSRVAKDQEDTLDLISLNDTKLTYANWIGEAKMVANNGLGQVRVALKMRKRGSYAQDQFTVTFMRRIKPLVDLTDDNLK